MRCNRCEGTGFLNIEQAPLEMVERGWEAVYGWMPTATGHDVKVCDCCGDGEFWYGEPGEHYSRDDPPGEYGPYASNGGLCSCH